jgi:hypothetical protein
LYVRSSAAVNADGSWENATGTPPAFTESIVMLFIRSSETELRPSCVLRACTRTLPLRYCGLVVTARSSR